MENASPVGRRQPIRDPRDELDNLPPGAGALIQPVFERSSIDEFGDEVLTSVEFARVVNRQDVWGDSETRPSAPRAGTAGGLPHQQFHPKEP